MREDKKIFCITPTYKRLNRVNYIKRCVNVFRNVKNLSWILVEDASEIDLNIESLLKISKIDYCYLHYGPTRCWGNHQRNHALSYIRDRRLEGIVYLADDDNYYDPRLFEEIRKTRKVSIMPVGLLGPNGIERPIVKRGKILGWDADWKERKYPIDMAGFAFDSNMLLSLKDPLWDFMPQDKRRGGESEFLARIISSADQFEILCNRCTKCYVWHDLPLGETPGWYYFKRYRLAVLSVLIRKMIPAQIRKKLKWIFGIVKSRR